MSKSIEDPILSALRSYERAPSNSKRAVLLTAQGGYFLYGDRFCGIQDYELERRCFSAFIKSVFMPRARGP